MFKVGFERGGRIKRCNANTNLTESFDVFVPMVISTQEYTGLREDLVNRSFVIKMSEAPRSYRLDKIVDKEALAAIRHELHHLALLCKVQVRFLDDRKEDGFRLPAFLRDSEHYLEGTRDEDGTFSYPLKSGIDNSRHKELRGRQFDIARSMYPMARLTGDVNPLFEKLGRMAASNRDKLRLTDYGMVMDAWIDTIRDRSPQDKQAFVEKSRCVPTKLIANTCLYNGIEAGDFLPTDTIKTQAVRRPLETMGFILGYGSGNMTYVQKTPGYDNLLATNIKKFASPCNSDYFEGLPGTIEGATSEATNPSKSDTPDIAIMQSPVSNPTEGAQTDTDTAGERR